MKHLFIINPVAGGKDQRLRIMGAAAKALHARNETDYDFYVTRGPMDAVEKIRTAAAEAAGAGTELRVYACGGDGTLNECCNGAAGLSHVAVTHYPCGTGNDFIKQFGADKALFSRIDRLLDGEVRPLDLISCNGRYSVNICSVGVDARIGTQVHQYSALPLVGGATGYLVSVGVNLIRGINQRLTVTTEEEVPDTGEFALVCVCNGTWYGGSFNPVPEARPDDGMLDVLLVRGVSRLTFLRLVGEYAKGNYARYPRYIRHVRTRSITISGDEPFIINLDGEALESDRAEMTVCPGALRFLFPAGLEK